eukprot:scaffold175725_cov33-Prasinocladus_malaysianus.AAC.1
MMTALSDKLQDKWEPSRSTYQVRRTVHPYMYINLSSRFSMLPPFVVGDCLTDIHFLLTHCSLLSAKFFAGESKERQ